VARRLGLAPRQCLAIEDSLNGVLAAKSARVPCIAVPDPYPGHPGFAIADAVIPSLAELGDDTWKRLAG
jgi:beta-phosphoglucomutase-like phosphatase (HAD superfamily)